MPANIHVLYSIWWIHVWAKQEIINKRYAEYQYTHIIEYMVLLYLSVFVLIDPPMKMKALYLRIQISLPYCVRNKTVSDSSNKKNKFIWSFHKEQIIQQLDEKFSFILVLFFPKKCSVPKNSIRNISK